MLAAAVIAWSLSANTPNALLRSDYLREPEPKHNAKVGLGNPSAVTIGHIQYIAQPSTGLVAGGRNASEASRRPASLIKHDRDPMRE